MKEAEPSDRPHPSTFRYSIRGRRLQIMGATIFQHRLQHARRRHRQLGHPNSGCAIDRVGDRSWRRHDRDLADTAHAERMNRVGNLDDYGFDHRQVETGWHPIIEQTDIFQCAVRVVKIFLVKRPPEALRAAALHLTFDIAGMNCLAGVLGNGTSQQLHLAGIWIDFHVDTDSRECGSNSDSTSTDLSASRYWTAGACEALGDILN